MKSMEVNQMSAETRKEFTPMELQWVRILKTLTSTESQC